MLGTSTLTIVIFTVLLLGGTTMSLMKVGFGSSNGQVLVFPSSNACVKSLSVSQCELGLEIISSLN